MIIAGVDPGTTSTGYAFIKVDSRGDIKALDFGCIYTASDLILPKRLEKIFDDFRELCDKHNPDVLSVESIYFNKNAKTVISIGHASGVIILAAALKGIPVESYTPLQVKMALVGYGRAEKKQVQKMVKLLLGLPKVPKPDDTADALAIAICHANSYELRERLKQA